MPCSPTTATPPTALLPAYLPAPCRASSRCWRAGQWMRPSAMRTRRWSWLGAARSRAWTVSGMVGQGRAGWAGSSRGASEQHVVWVVCMQLPGGCMLLCLSTTAHVTLAQPLAALPLTVTLPHHLPLRRHGAALPAAGGGDPGREGLHDQGGGGGRRRCHARLRGRQGAVGAGCGWLNCSSILKTAHAYPRCVCVSIATTQGMRALLSSSGPAGGGHHGRGRPVCGGLPLWPAQRHGPASLRRDRLHGRRRRGADAGE